MPDERSPEANDDPPTGKGRRPNPRDKRRPEEGPEDRAYDLRERSAKFGEAIIRFAKRIPRNPVTIPIIGQLVSAGTSVGANYSEADDAVSRRDFRNKVGICRKEASESKHWLRMTVAAEESLRDEARGLWQEADQLHRIFAKSFQTASQERPAGRQGHRTFPIHRVPLGIRDPASVIRH